jgi:TRAP-type mannitol/chloroaromatic compound transport system substrate-binding protein
MIRSALKAMLAAAAFGGLASMATADTTANWRLTHFAGETSAFYTLTTLPFIERLTQLTRGEVSITPYPGGVLAPSLEGYNAVRDGIADVGHLTPMYIVNVHPANSFWGGHPGGMGPEAFIQWLYEAGGADLLAEFRRETSNMHGLILSAGPAEVWHSHTPIRTPEDLAGLRFRSGSAWATILAEYFDAAPTSVPGSEVYTMLERRAIDVAEWSTPSENIIAGLHNAAPYVITPGAHTPSWAFELVMPAARWDALDEETQNMIEAAAKLSTLETLHAWRAADIIAMEQIYNSTAEVVTLDDSMLIAIREAGRAWAYAEAERLEAEGDTWMRRVADSYYGFYDKWLESQLFGDR